jgi:hypothetical protein
MNSIITRYMRTGLCVLSLCTMLSFCLDGSSALTLIQVHGGSLIRWDSVIASTTGGQSLP